MQKLTSIACEPLRVCRRLIGVSYAGLCCANRVRDSCRKFSVVAGRHEQTVVQHLQNQELASLQRSAQARRFTALLTIWFDPDMSWDAAPSGKQGRQQTYSVPAIQTCLTMKVLFGMALRQTTGFGESLLRLVGLDWPVPDFSTLSRRQKTLAVNIPYRGSNGPLHLLIPLVLCIPQLPVYFGSGHADCACSRGGGGWIAPLLVARDRSRVGSPPPFLLT